MDKPGLGVERGDTWSTWGEENRLYEWLGGHSSASVSTLGTTREDRPIRMVTFGDTAKPTLLLVGGVHGNEPSAREVMLWMAREMVASNMYREVLRGASIAIIPNANPDGRIISERGNSIDVDPNRDHISLDEAEAQATNTAIRQLDPVMAGDFHEYGSEDADVWVQGPFREDAHPEIGEHRDAAQAAMLAAAEDAGYDAEPYPLHPRLGLHAISSLKHFVGMLVEVRWRGWTRPQRFEAQKAPLDALVEYFAANAQDLRHAQAASRASAKSRPGPELLYVWSDWANPGSGQRMSLDGYDLAEELGSKYVEAHGITVSGSTVPMGQVARGVLPELLDPEADKAVVTASRVISPTVPATPFASAYVRVGGGTRPVIQMLHMDSGTRRVVTVGQQTAPDEPGLLEDHRGIHRIAVMCEQRAGG